MVLFFYIYSFRLVLLTTSTPVAGSSMAAALASTTSSTTQQTATSSTDPTATAITYPMMNLQEVALTGPVPTTIAKPDGSGTERIPAGPGQDGALLKAGWNYQLVGNDAGLGVHYPGLCTQALGNAYTTVQKIQ